jgi:ubiquinone/menaquinone biosynthesis C-methylase UbiE
LLYLQLREKEGRIYGDEEVIQLPIIPPTHAHYGEWCLRRESCRRLTRYLDKKNKPLDILEIGCGNGWLSHRLASIRDSRVIGTDINFAEIEQAARVFQHIPNLHFVYADRDQSVFLEKKFDVIVYAASIQYFGALQKTVTEKLRLLKPAGELHIIDSPLYPGKELPGARQRTRFYYETRGFPRMADFYFHHCLEDLQQFNYSIRYDPANKFNRLRGWKNPFPWICIGV